MVRELGGCRDFGLIARGVCVRGWLGGAWVVRGWRYGFYYKVCYPKWRVMVMIIHVNPCRTDSV